MTKTEAAAVIAVIKILPKYAEYHRGDEYRRILDRQFNEFVELVNGMVDKETEHAGG